MKIAIDVMGGDLAPKAPVLGALAAADRFGCEVVLVGDSAQIEPLLEGIKHVMKPYATTFY